MTVVPFIPIGPEALGDRQDEARQLAKRRRRPTGWGWRSIRRWSTRSPIAAREVESGARNVDHIISGSLLPKISNEILQQMATGSLPDKVKVVLDDKGEFAFEFSRK